MRRYCLGNQSSIGGSASLSRPARTQWWHLILCVCTCRLDCISSCMLSGDDRAVLGPRPSNDCWVHHLRDCIAWDHSCPNCMHHRRRVWLPALPAQSRTILRCDCPDPSLFRYVSFAALQMRFSWHLYFHLSRLKNRFSQRLCQHVHCSLLFSVTPSFCKPIYNISHCMHSELGNPRSAVLGTDPSTQSTVRRRLALFLVGTLCALKIVLLGCAA